MVKQAVKEKKRSPLVPVAGLLLALGLAVVAYFLTNLIIDQNFMGAGAALKSTGANYNISFFALAVILWLIMTAIGYFLVSLLVGKDPDPMSAQNIPMRPRNIKKK
ncbi:MAG: hypothetical protein KF716_27530 [Anaerolineae bacterium]|nr:hypothetical protein [Anaerolineae bacterium]